MSCKKHSIIWKMFITATRRHSWERIDIHEKEFHNYSKFLQEFWRSDIETDVRCHRAVGEWPKRNSWSGQNSVKKDSWKRLSLIGDETVINLQSTKLDTISFSDLSRIHFTSRWSGFTFKRMDSRKNENWTCIGSHDKFSEFFKYGVEIRIWSVNQDNSQSWFRISYGTIKYVTDSSQDNTEISADPQEERVSQTSIKGDAVRSKTKAKSQPRVLVGTTATIPIHEKRWIDIESSKQDFDSCNLSKKVINLLRHNQTLQREENGALEFYRKFYLRNHHSQIQVWSCNLWKACLTAWGKSKKKFSIALIIRAQIVCLRALQKNSGSNFIDPTSQNNVVIGTGIFHYIYHIGCALNLHSIISNRLILGDQDLSKRQAVFFYPLIQKTKVTQILNILTSLFHVDREMCTVHGKGTKTRYSGLILIFRSKNINILSKHDRMQLFFKGLFQSVAFKKLKNWKLEKSCMKKDICLLDNHERSRWNTVTIGPKGMINWVLQWKTRSTVFGRRITC